MTICRECGAIHSTDNEYFCPKCQAKCDKRNEFRQVMSKLEGLIDLDHFEGNYMSGYSYSEMERFSLIFRKLQKRYHFPIEKNEFVNSSAKKEVTLKNGFKFRVCPVCLYENGLEDPNAMDSIKNIGEW